MWFGHPSDAASSGAFLSAVTKQSVTFLRESECDYNHMGGREKPAGHFLGRHLMFAFRLKSCLLCDLWLLCVWEKSRLCWAHLCAQQAAQRCFSPFLVGWGQRAEVRLEGSQAMARGHLAFRGNGCLNGLSVCGCQLHLCSIRSCAIHVCDPFSSLQSFL